MAAVRRTPPSLRDLGQVLREFRQARELTQEQLSFSSGLTTALISDSENGKRNLSFESLGRLLVALDVGWDEFGAALARQHRRRQ